MGAKQLKIDDLLLNLENPRIVGAQNQRHALQKLLDDQEERLFFLAEDIVENGMSPIERILVCKKRGNLDDTSYLKEIAGSRS